MHITTLFKTQGKKTKLDWKYLALKKKCCDAVRNNIIPCSSGTYKVMHWHITATVVPLSIAEISKKVTSIMVQFLSLQYYVSDQTLALEMLWHGDGSNFFTASRNIPAWCADS